MKIEVTGLEETIKDLKNRLSEVPTAMEDWLGGHGDDALERVKMRTPVGETGDLRRNWEKQPIRKSGNDYSLEITNLVEYLAHVEWGHRIIDRRGNFHGVLPGVFMAKISREITKDAMKKDISSLAKRISGNR